jgi:hypothetical protein
MSCPRKRAAPSHIHLRRRSWVDHFLGDRWLTAICYSYFLIWAWHVQIHVHTLVQALNARLVRAGREVGTGNQPHHWPSINFRQGKSWGMKTLVWLWELNPTPIVPLPPGTISISFGALRMKFLRFTNMIKTRVRTNMGPKICDL